MMELTPPPDITPEKNAVFYDNFFTAVLLALLEDKKLTEAQFESCLAELDRRRAQLPRDSERRI
jgi:hypothetical protein